MRWKHSWSLAILFLSTFSWAVERGVIVREAQMYIAPDLTAQKLGTVTRGREVVLLEHSRNFVNVLVDYGEGRSVSGWMLDKGVVFSTTPNGDKVIFGEAADSEREAEKRRGRKGAELDAMRLYYELNEVFPDSPLAAEALYRAADIRWQLDYSDVFSRRSAKEKDPGMRSEIDNNWFKKVEKKAPNSKWADLAQYHYLDNKICGDWQGDPKCPEKETNLYEDYVKNHPNSPKVYDALMQAALRQAALIQMYKADGDMARSESAKQRAIGFAQRAQSTARPDSDEGPRAQRIIYMVENDIALYGTSIE